jgi:hypothetical protein
MLSTIDSIEPMRQALRWSAQEKKKVPISQPNMIARYNEYMGGVDRMDQNINNYRVSIKSKKWWYSCFAFAIDTACHNAWQLYRKSDQGKLDYLGFRRYVTTSYLRTNAANPSSTGRRSSEPIAKRSKRVNDSVRYDGYNHWMVHTDSRPRCAVCDARARFRCEKCDVGLCINCFKEFHTKE